MEQLDRKQVRDHLNAKVAAGQPINIVGCGTGLVAKAAEQGGMDFVGLYHSSFYRWECYRMNNYRINGNQLVLEMTRRAAQMVDKTLILPGVICHDPTINIKDYFQKLIDAGASGVMAFPTVAMYDGRLRDMYEDAGHSLEREMEVLHLAQDLGLFTFIYAFNEDHIRTYAKADIDAILIHMGPTQGGLRPCADVFYGRTLEDCAHLINQMARIVQEVNPRAFILTHGGPISTPADAQYIYDRTPSMGFLGAASFERIPVETPIVEKTQAFKAITLPER